MHHAAKGGNGSWDRTAEISPTVPTLRAVTTNIGRAFPTSFNGVAHSTPNYWPDVEVLAQALVEERVADNFPDEDEAGKVKPVRAVRRSVDVWQEGVKALQDGKAIAEWKKKRSMTLADLDLWAEDDERRALMGEEADRPEVGGPPQRRDQAVQADPNDVQVVGDEHRTLIDMLQEADGLGVGAVEENQEGGGEAAFDPETAEDLLHEVSLEGDVDVIALMSVGMARLVV